MRPPLVRLCSTMSYTSSWDSTISILTHSTRQLWWSVGIMSLLLERGSFCACTATNNQKQRKRHELHEHEKRKRTSSQSNHEKDLVSDVWVFESLVLWWSSVLVVLCCVCQDNTKTIQTQHTGAYTRSETFSFGSRSKGSLSTVRLRGVGIEGGVEVGLRKKKILPSSLKKTTFLLPLGLLCLSLSPRSCESERDETKRREDKERRPGDLRASSPMFLIYVGCWTLTLTLTPNPKHPWALKEGKDK